MIEYMPVELPVKPDPETGEPRPPYAPISLKTPPKSTADINLAGPVPEGRGPALEVFAQDKLVALLGSAVIVVVIIIGTTLQTGSLDWITDPVLLVALAAVGLFMVWRGWGTRLTAGSDWLRANSRWIDTYNITKIHLYGVIVGWTIVLQDTEGRKIRTHIGSLEANRDLWALVYNGIVHSVHAGAEYNALAEGMLDLRKFKAQKAE